MSAPVRRCRSLGPALATSLWIGFAPVPAPGWSAAGIATIWDLAGRHTDGESAHPRSSQRGDDPTPVAPRVDAPTAAGPDRQLPMPAR